MNELPMPDDEVRAPTDHLVPNDPLEAARRANVENRFQAMLKEIRTSAFWLIGVGVVSIVASGFLSAAWGILLVVVGLASFFIKDAALFVVYGVTLAWAAISNALGGIHGQGWGWAAFSLLQIYLVIRVFRDYRGFRRVQSEWQGMPHPDDQAAAAPSRVVRAFPAVGCLLGALALVGVVILFVALLDVVGWLEVEEVGPALDFVINLAVLGLAVSLAGLLARYRPKVLAVLGIIANSIVLLLYVALALLSSPLFSAAGTLLGPGNTLIAPLLTSTPASELNLSLADLRGEYTLATEVGKEAFEDAQLTDASIRLFTNDQVNLQAQVLTFPFVASDKIEDLVAPVQQELAVTEGNEELSFEPLRAVRVGNRAGVLRFSRPSTEEGYIFYSVRRNVVVRLLTYGAEGAISEAELLRLAALIDERIR